MPCPQVLLVHHEQARLAELLAAVADPHRPLSEIAAEPTRSERNIP